MRNLFDVKISCCSVLILLLGLSIGLSYSTKETFVVLYGYLPTVGVAFTLASRQFVDRKAWFTTLMIISYTILQYTFINPNISIVIRHFDLKLIILAAIGALLTLLFFTIFSSKSNHNTKSYISIFILGLLSFIPQQINFNIPTLLTSIFIWQLVIGTFLKYLTAANIGLAKNWRTT